MSGHPEKRLLIHGVEGKSNFERNMLGSLVFFMKTNGQMTPKLTEARDLTDVVYGGSFQLYDPEG
jgi:hypothetical protein